MDKYPRHAGDYDEAITDVEPDDDAMLNASMTAQYDDGDTDHPSESDEDGASMGGEETPKTQTRNGRSPLGSMLQWTMQQAADFIASLSPALKQYCQSFTNEGINGEALAALGHNELDELGVHSVGHRLTILKAVYEQKLRSGVRIEEGDYVPPTAESSKADAAATQDDMARVIESLRIRDQRIYTAEAELRALRHDLERIVEDNRKLREETLPIMRLVKDQRTPLPDPAGGTIPLPRDGGAPKQQLSPTHAPQTFTRSDDHGDSSGHVGMTSQQSPNSLHGAQMSPTSPAYSTHAPSSGGSYHPPGSARNFPRQHGQQHATHEEAHPTWPTPAKQRQPPIPSPREEDHRERERDGRDREKDREKEKEKDNHQVEIFKSFRVGIEDPCRVVLPVALKRYNITDDWRQYALYIVHGDQERCLGLEEKPLLLFKQLDKEGRKPMFMLRRHASPQEGWSGTSHGSDKTIPGGVL
ncbi:RA-domain-containing protein [Piedraia hortae CBS 480.64]|uniref:RA-domain-containing protein n=1 Tax=Piedraia hortae CBS 480.64 TaxID=1314780 RepID=A0A6A7C805_9PEZI|nr:RA-domain-containing protein [Piedraia hortae CBS 480.64]